MLLIVFCIIILVSCFIILEYIYNRGCVSVGLFILKKFVLINKFNIYIINIVKYNVKWGIY